MPTAKEAGSFIGVMMALIFVPFYVVGLVFSDLNAVIVRSSPLSVLRADHRAPAQRTRHTLGILESVIVIGILFICTAVMLRFAFTSSNTAPSREQRGSR
jgi:ABC-2 type transport system permease protein